MGLINCTLLQNSNEYLLYCNWVFFGFLFFIFTVSSATDQYIITSVHDYSLWILSSVDKKNLSPSHCHSNGWGSNGVEQCDHKQMDAWMTQDAVCKFTMKWGGFTFNISEFSSLCVHRDRIHSSEMLISSFSLPPSPPPHRSLDTVKTYSFKYYAEVHNSINTWVNCWKCH